MLYRESIERSTLELLIKLQQEEYLKGFHLVGGTALAIRLGYRKSIDIVLFSNFDFDTEKLLESLSFDYQFKLLFSTTNTLKGRIGDVQIDILAHRYPLINEPTRIENVSMLSIEDITAMKLNAITVSGQRVKDFIDLYYLLDKFSVAEMISFYKKKYSQHNEVNVLKSITWFDDVELADWPILIKDPKLEWKTIKQKIIATTNDYLKTIKDQLEP
ncbi:MAG: nucleotidyl transferase AbiEii/AbiGii toxin family protein [Bacteroidales bacterium]|nr:nucleotidyl transferase AbiEii/AbiGii toxin family protein [Bacteroidales bacterium]